jgi:hypothetical protein
VADQVAATNRRTRRLSEGGIYTVETERIRSRFRPTSIKVLFVGESAPQSGKFFYKGDTLTTYTQQAFEKALEVTYGGHQQFLQCFKALGCYLEDLSHIPVNGMQKPEREAALERSVRGFLIRLRTLNPKAIVVSPKKIKKYVEMAVSSVGLNKAPTWYLPYPGYRRQGLYVDELARVLVHLRETGLL